MRLYYLLRLAFHSVVSIEFRLRNAGMRYLALGWFSSVFVPRRSTLQCHQKVSEIPRLPDVGTNQVECMRHANHVEQDSGVAGNEKEIWPKGLPKNHGQRSEHGEHPSIQERRVDGHGKDGSVPPEQKGKVQA